MVGTSHAQWSISPLRKDFSNPPHAQVEDDHLHVFHSFLSGNICDQLEDLYMMCDVVWWNIQWWTFLFWLHYSPVVNFPLFFFWHHWRINCCTLQIGRIKNGGENVPHLYDLEGIEVLGSYLEIQPCSENAPGLSKCSDVGEIFSALERLRVLDLGLKSTGGLMRPLPDEFTSRSEDRDGRGPVLEGDNDLALSARRACRSFLALRSSSSVRFLRCCSSSSVSPFTFAILARKSSTDSDPSFEKFMLKGLDWKEWPR